MRPIPPARGSRGGRPARWVDGVPSPTVSGMVGAAGTLALLAVGSLLLLIPAVFFVLPLPPDVDAVTLCVPGMGPLQRFREGLEEEQEELVHVHERVHAEQCRAFGAAWYARKAMTPSGRLTLEASALCAEVAMLSGRGEDPGRLRDWTLEALLSGYLERGVVPRSEIAAAVDQACGPSMGD